MSEATRNETIGPYRIVRNKDGQKLYYAGFHENGQVRWVNPSEDNAVRYPTVELANTVMRTLKTDIGESLNVVRVIG